MIKTILERIFKNKVVLILLGVATLSLLAGLIYSYINAGKKANKITFQSTTPTLQQAQNTSGLQNTGISLFGSATNLKEVQSLPDEVKAESQTEKEKVLSKLPIYLKNFQTSVGIKTTINIFSVKTDQTHK
jgi:LPS O-antigen subunit length determinant protein (WzzB/FepE family)